MVLGSTAAAMKYQLSIVSEGEDYVNLSLIRIVLSLGIYHIDQTFNTFPATSIDGRVGMFESCVRAYCQISQNQQLHPGWLLEYTTRIPFRRHRVEALENQQLVWFHVPQEVPPMTIVMINIVGFSHKVCVDIVARHQITLRVNGRVIAQP